MPGTRETRVPAVGPVVPIAVAVAVSSVPIMTTFFILLSPNRPRSALPFLLGWVGGIAIVVSACAFFAYGVPTPRSSRQPDTAVGTLEILAGAGLIALAAVTWVRRHHRTAPPASAPGHPRANPGPWSALGLGIILNLRPKGLLLAIAGGLAIRADAEDLPAAVVAVAVYTVIGASTVAVPIILTLAAPARAEPRLVSANGWMLRNGPLVTNLVMIVIGLVVVGLGVARL